MMRSYDQSCALAHASDLLGERWTWLLVRELLIAPRRFSELEQRLHGIGANLLSKRLKELTSAGLIGPHRSGEGYELTPAGRALETVVLELIRWQVRWARATNPGKGLHYPDWDLLALKARFSPGRKLRVPLLARFVDRDWLGWARTDGKTCAFGIGEPPREPDIDFAVPVLRLQKAEAVLARLKPSQLRSAKTFLGYFARP